MEQKTYTSDQRKWAIDQMSPPLKRTAKDLALETGITQVTLRAWRKAIAAAGGMAEQESADGCSSASKFRAVLEAASLSEAELSEYCRRKAISLSSWRSGGRHANRLTRARSPERPRLR